VTQKVQLIRLAGACLCLLVGVSFCHAFSNFQANAFVYGAGVDPRSLPTTCILFLRWSMLLMLAPPALFAVGLAKLMKNPAPSPAAELCTAAALVLAILLVTACILAWQVPYAVPVGDMI
jgi:hypothetical protein